MTLTVTQLARACGLSRGTVLYYESLGLVSKPRRSGGNYRLYGEKDLARLRQVCFYRDAGLKLNDIRLVLDRPRGHAAGVLERRLHELSGEIERLREHQQAIARLLKDTDRLRRFDMVTKEKWVEVMSGAGFTREDMKRWHAQFETMAPQEHQEFLEFLHIPAEEIAATRKSSREGK
jgi:MerR family transcriptional regulator, thiopeptide resistance regulator